MRVRRIAILIDGGFFLKRLPKVVEERFRDTPAAIAETARHLCKRHVLRLTREEPDRGRWLDHVYRLFYYDATPYEGVAHHPITNVRVDYGHSDIANFRNELFRELRQKRKFALRLGHVAKESDWRIDPRRTKRLLRTRRWVSVMDDYVAGHAPAHAFDDLSENEQRELRQSMETWRELEEADVSLGLRQKGVDMRIGLDITSITLKRQADTIILVTGDSDFVPAAKLARREGVEFILDPMRQRVKDDLNEHVDGVVTVLNADPAAPQEVEDDGA